MSKTWNTCNEDAIYPVSQWFPKYEFRGLIWNKLAVQDFNCVQVFALYTLPCVCFFFQLKINNN